MLRIDAEPKLASLTSLHLGGRALALLTFSELQDLDDLPETLNRIGGRVVPLGGGTNILAQDGVLPVTLLRCEMRAEPEIVTQNEHTVLVKAGAGMKLPRLLAWCARRGLSGLEGMAGVPGNVGGAVAGNAGAHGMDMGSVLRQITIFSPQTGVVTLGRAQFQCEYRAFSLPEVRAEWFVIAEVVLELGRSTPKEVHEAVRKNVARKIHVQPVHDWSAGCLFKNPAPEESELSAGLLLDRAGFRGKRMGGMCLSPVHANFLVNEGNGSAEAALRLVHEAQETVLRLFGVSLHPEVKIWVF